ncbi:hypothetical protein BC940DRAFT_371940 [Gongronella butleri]|nr:hypothetical protein BC940DRAFT_371940 [Gongronella butleri]
MSTEPPRTTIRYSRDVFVALYNSPLVAKPEAMPALEKWFGEEAGSPAIAKILLNSSIWSQPQDVPLNGKSNARSSPIVPRSRLMDDRSHKRMDRTYQNKNGNNHNNNNNNGHGGVPINANGPGTRRYSDRNQPKNYRQGNSSNSNHGRGPPGTADDAVPDWMDDSDFKTNDMRDLEAWKSSMRQKEAQLEKGGQDTPREDKPVNKIDQLFGNMDISSSLFDTSLPDTSKRSSRFARFFKEPTPPPGDQRSPLHRPQEAQQQQPLQQQQQQHDTTKSISVSDLFQQPQTTPDSTAATSSPAANKRVFSEEELLQSFAKPRAQGPPANGPAIAAPMPMDANNGASPASDASSSSMGFNKVLQILSQPKPQVDTPGSAQSSPSPAASLARSTPPNSTPLAHLEEPFVRGASPSSRQFPMAQPMPLQPMQQMQPMQPIQSMQPMQSMSPSSSSPQESPRQRQSMDVSPLAKHKFGNLPTSVLRQMSARDKRASPTKPSPVLKQTHFNKTIADPAMLNASSMPNATANANVTAATPMDASSFLPHMHQQQQHRPPHGPYPPPMMGIPPMMHQRPNMPPMPPMQPPFMPMHPHPNAFPPVHTPSHPNASMMPPPPFMMQQQQQQQQQQRDQSAANPWPQHQ